MLSGLAAASYAGPSVILSFVLAGIVAILAALSFSELATMMPHSGAAYTYTYTGQFVMLSLFFFYHCNFFSSRRYSFHPNKNSKTDLFCCYL